MKFLLILGSVRDSTPPRPARLGWRVAAACLHCLQARFAAHEFVLVDALDYPLEFVFKPHFSYPAGKAPNGLDSLADQIAAADGYIMLSPEYNHAMSPALANLLNHFGSSLFSFKPSAIVTYSAGQWGGMRAAVNLRTFLAELGCLPVSAMIHVPTVTEILAADGSVLEGIDEEAWFAYFARTFHQLIWWAQAASAQRALLDPQQLSAAFRRDPAQRNAP